MSRIVVRGDRAIIRKLTNLSKPARVRAAAREALSAGAKVMNKSLKDAVPQDAPGVTRTIGRGEKETVMLAKDFLPEMRKSIGRRKRTYKDIVFEAVGPRYEYTATHKPSGEKFAPSAIAKATEFGTSRKPAAPFMRPGFQKGARPALAAVTARMALAIAKQAAKG